VNPLAPVVRYALTIALLLSSAFGAYHWYGHTSTENTLLRERAQRAEQDSARSELARTKDKVEREKEYQRGLSGQEIADAFQKQIDLRETQLRSERAGADRLRNDAAAFAARRGEPGQACPAELEGTRDRAATLGDLLTQADGLAGEFADAAERHAAEARTLKERVTSDRTP
jgi:Protein of unknown function (DUF2514)